ncbi:MAG: A/G-specific adenine glycosylase [Acidobacteria bacterium]|nr:A/G-specific adenine glycosylase [Acidobacteriota bacterium]
MVTPPPDARAPALLRRALLTWYDGARRDLPWRRTRDPYAIWVSEVMAQQTTVQAVIPFWERFLASFPDVRALAAAPLEEVLRLWAGLGYYRRARFLHAAAREVVAARGGELPRTAAGWLTLPGVGGYTAAAIASIAFDEPAPVVDGNVVRVLARFDRMGDPPDRAAARRRFAARAGELLDPVRPGDANQALMELGATVCTPRAPRCPACPWSAACLARAAGDPERFPAAVARPETVPVLRGAVLVRDRRGRVLLRRIPEGEVNAGLLELPSATIREWSGASIVEPPSRPTELAALARRGLARALAKGTGLAVTLRDALGTERHAITQRRITVVLFAATLRGAAPRGRAWSWHAPEDLTAAGLTSASRKLARFVGSGWSLH